jgi:NTE family protein
MTPKDFTEDPRILALMRDLRERIADKHFSDVIDDAGHQYVDLVMEGGGVLGIALTGYVHVLEELNIRFLGLGGTSAGSINALLMAAAGTIDQAKTDFIFEALANKNLFDFVDGDNDAKDFVKVLIEKKKKMSLLWKGWQVIDNFNEDFGLNPGNNFYKWVEGLLKSRGILNRIDLQKQMHTLPPGIRHRNTNAPYQGKHKLALVAADVTTQTKVEFPLMADLYWDDPDKVNPAYFVRASMSIPLFFHPLRIKNIPATKEAKDRWFEQVRYIGAVPKEVMFIDGGIMSNFPIDIFHDHTRVPAAPTFGVKLGVDRTKPNKNETVFQLIGSIFDSARQVHDLDFILRNPDYRLLVSSINTGDHDWLNFNISDQDKIDLFLRGAETAANFLKDFEWEKYKQLRKASLDVYQTAPAATPAIAASTVKQP